MIRVWNLAAAACFIVGFASGFNPQGATAPERHPSSGAAASAKDPGPHPAIPDSAAEMIRLATTVNGLDKADMPPWHVEMSYDEYDDDGDNVRSGRIEEFYSGPKKYKRIYSGDTLNQTDFATETGLHRVGDQRWPLPTEVQVWDETLRPLHGARLDESNTKLDKTDWQIGTAKLPCVIIRRTDLIVSDNGLPKFCFDPGTLMLRYTRGRGWDETTYNNIVFFQGRYVARDVAVSHAGKLFLKIHIDELQNLPSVEESTFTPPANSTRIGERITLSPVILLSEYLISSRALSRPRNETGKSTVNFVVGKDGRVIQADAVDGPKELRKAALDAIRGYRFRPFLVLDQPVEVESTMFFEVR